MTKATLLTYGGMLHDIGYAGDIVDFQPTELDSKINESATAIDFGVPVSRGAADNTCKPFATIADKVIGVSVRHAIRPPIDLAGNVKYAQYDSVPLLRQNGFIYAVAVENATRDDVAIALTATANFGSTTGGAAGAGRLALDGTSGNIKAIWETTTAAGSIGIIRVVY